MVVESNTKPPEGADGLIMKILDPVLKDLGAWFFISLGYTLYFKVNLESSVTT